jgi:ABC-type Fe3+ transport system permease subunit
VIARPLPYEEVASPPRSGTRAGRTAVRRRRARTRRERYSALSRVVSTIVVLVVVVTVYLALMANVTRMNYELTRLAQQRAQLLDETSAGDQAIASAESIERLRADAKALHMSEWRTFALVDLPQDPPKPSGGIAFLGWLK